MLPPTNPILSGEPAASRGRVVGRIGKVDATGAVDGAHSKRGGPQAAFALRHGRNEVADGERGG